MGMPPVHVASTLHIVSFTVELLLPAFCACPSANLWTLCADSPNGVNLRVALTTSIIWCLQSCFHFRRVQVTKLESQVTASLLRPRLLNILSESSVNKYLTIILSARRASLLTNMYTCIRKRRESRRATQASALRDRPPPPSSVQVLLYNVATKSQVERYVNRWRCPRKRCA